MTLQLATSTSTYSLRGKESPAAENENNRLNFICRDNYHSGAMVHRGSSRLDCGSMASVPDDDDGEAQVGRGGASAIASASVSVNSLSTNTKITDAKIRAFLHDYYEDYNSMDGCIPESWDIFFSKYFVPDFQWIRPSGNPIGKEGLISMFTKDIQIVSVSLVSIDNIKILAGQQSAVAIFTADQTFSYKGKRNEDRAVSTGVMEMQGDDIKMVQEHRTSGKPIPRETRWATQM